MTRRHVDQRSLLDKTPEGRGILARMLDIMTGKNARVKADTDPEQTKEVEGILAARRQRWMMKRQAKVGRPARADGWPGGRKWAHRTTGQPDWFRSMKHAAERQRILSNIKTSSLVAEFKDLRNFQDAYPNVWALSRASYVDLKALPGVGPAKLKALRAYLSSKNVPCAWRIP